MKCQSDQQCEGRCWIKTGTASSSKDTPPNQEKDGLVYVPKIMTDSTAEIEDADFEMPIAAFITREATSSTGAPTLSAVPEETQSNANWRTGRRVISTENF